MIPQQQPAGDNRTKCGPTLQRLLDQYGQDHLVTVLKTFTETQGNAGALVEQAILAVSASVRAHPSWPERASLWFDIFDTISIRDLVALAKPLKPTGEKARSAIAGMLLAWLAPVFDPPKPKIDRRKVKHAERRPGSAIKAIEIGLVLRQHKGPHQNSGIAHVAHKHGIWTNGGASHYIRAANLYGDRVDLVRFLPRSVLFKLASPVLPQAAREEAERLLAAGGKLTGPMVDAIAKRAAQQGTTAPLPV